MENILVENEVYYGMGDSNKDLIMNVTSLFKKDELIQRQIYVYNRQGEIITIDDVWDYPWTCLDTHKTFA